MISRIRSLPTLFLLFALGCAHYEYDVIHPPELALHVSAKDEVVIKREPVEYRLITYEDHLVVRILNPTDDPIRLVGEQSSAVDPKGKGHPFRSAVISPRGLLKMVLPPIFTPAARDSFINVQISSGGADPNYPLPEMPRDIAPLDESPFWEWPGESEVRVTLIFEKGDQTFQHEFVLRRAKVQ